jgi:hypothetical protein
VTFSSFNFGDAVSEDKKRSKANEKKLERAETHWEKKESHCGLSADGVALVYSLPGFLKKSALVSYSSGLRANVPKTNSPGTYKQSSHGHGQGGEAWKGWGRQKQPK